MWSHLRYVTTEQVSYTYFLDYVSFVDETNRLTIYFVMRGFAPPGLEQSMLLALAQAIGGASASIVIATAPLVGYSMLDTDKSLATLPVSAMVLGTAFGTIPAGMIMRRYGRRTGFMGAALLGAIAGLLAAFAVFQDEFLMFALGLITGSYTQ